MTDTQFFQLNLNKSKEGKPERDVPFIIFVMVKNEQIRLAKKVARQQNQIKGT